MLNNLYLQNILIPTTSNITCITFINVNSYKKLKLKPVNKIFN